jgi:hypothetical protein
MRSVPRLSRNDFLREEARSKRTAGMYLDCPAWVQRLRKQTARWGGSKFQIN